ncbi:MAG: hypothetical protein FWJ92_03785 [Actinomycetes bacterium]|jgi:hypothetical protein
MTTFDPPAASPPLAAGNGKLRARMWIGHNPLLFVLGCAAAGVVLGRRSVRRGG